jgi:hypothetical protein
MEDRGKRDLQVIRIELIKNNIPPTNVIILPKLVLNCFIEGYKNF